jgi:uncharacterized protein YbjT (DUF2867 family)
MKVLIAGATGLVGNELLNLLIQDADIREIHVLSRRAPVAGSPKIKLHLAELGSNWLDSVRELRFDAVYCCLGTTMKTAGSREAFRKVDFDAVVMLARYAKDSDAGFFGMISSVGADSRSKSFYLRVKGEVEDVVRALGLRSYAILNPSVLIGDRHESRPAEKLAMVMLPWLNPLMIGGFRKYRGVDAADVARELWRRSKK